MLSPRLRRREPTVLSFDECQYRALLHKEWARSKMQQFKLESVVLSKLMDSQERALEELKCESVELYNMAIQVGMLVCVCVCVDRFICVCMGKVFN